MGARAGRGGRPPTAFRFYQLPWISRLETELDNIRAALDRTLSAGDEAEGTALVLAMGWFWWLRNYRREGMTWVDRVLRLGVARDRRSPTAPAPADGRRTRNGSRSRRW